MRKAVTFIILLALPLMARAVEPRSPLELELLGASEAQLATLDEGRKQGLIELAPVSLPVDPPGDNDHYGWPDGARVDDTIIVVYRRLPGHKSREVSGQADEHTSYSMVVRSTDDGRTWSKPFDLRQVMDPADRVRGGIIPLSHRYKFGLKKPISNLGYKLHLSAIGTTRDGGVVVIGSHGVFRTDDKGLTWTHFSEAFREDHHEGPMVFVGPRIIDHPRHGLLLFAHETFYKNHAPGKIERRLGVYRSRDGGGDWENIGVDVPDWCEPGSPNAILYDDAVLLMGRNLKSRRLVQLWYRPGEPVKAKDTNLASEASVDTSDLMFNPVTRRFEVVQSDRSEMSVNLFSIAAKDWDTAKWRLEARLFKRAGSFYSTADGFHTGGAVIDEERGVQHIFFYSGHPGGPAGVFRLTRTLDTPKLREFLKPRNRPDKRDTVHWTGNARSGSALQSSNWNDSGNWDIGVPDQHDVVIFEQPGAGQSIRIDDVADIGKLELGLAKKTERLTLTGSGRLVIHGAETIRNKYSTALVETGILDLGPELNVEIRNQRFVAGNRDGTVVIRSNKVRAGTKEPTTDNYKSDGEHLKLSITDRGRFVLMTDHWEPGMSLDMSASHTEGPKVFDFALKDAPQGVTFIRLKEHDGDAVEIRGFDEDDFFRFRADPFKSCDKGKKFRIDAVKFVGWPDNGKAAVERHGEYWYLKPATAGLPRD